MSREVTTTEVNTMLQEAAQGQLRGVLGYEHRELVSADYTNDTRSGVVDGPSTMVIDGRLLKVLVWYDNEYGYVHRMAELAAKVAHSIDGTK
jgi:glyceraldehyde 3-phosphate dehydrogenase